MKHFTSGFVLPVRKTSFLVAQSLLRKLDGLLKALENLDLEGGCTKGNNINSSTFVVVLKVILFNHGTNTYLRLSRGTSRRIIIWNMDETGLFWRELPN